MEHVVFFTGPTGPGFRRVPDLAEALASVEHLRNVAGIEDATVHVLTPVALAFKTYVKVEVTGGAGESADRESSPAPTPNEATAEQGQARMPAAEVFDEAALEATGLLAEPVTMPVAVAEVANVEVPTVEPEVAAPTLVAVPTDPPAVEADLPGQRQESAAEPAESAAAAPPEELHQPSGPPVLNVLPEAEVAPVRTGRGMGFFQR